ncbi:MAG: hypothetical protein K6E91_10780 [Butyrivibrio sp.]|nr:hypothetical protein [Butyrivibrio sp.]
MEDERRRGKRRRAGKESKGGIPVYVHVIVIALILGVIAFSVFRLVRWNMGTVRTEGVVEGDFEVEVEDQVFLLPEDKKALHEDDGVETILFLGNDILTFYNNDEGFVEQVGQKTGARVYKGGFTGSTVANKNAQYDESFPMDAFSFYNVSRSIVSRDFALMEEAAGLTDDPTYANTTKLLEDLDMSSVDTLVIFYDAQDYIKLRIGMNPDDDSDPITYSGALYAGIRLLQDKYPFIRIVCMSFPMCYAYNSEGAIVSGDMSDFGNGRLTTYRQFMIDVSGATGVTFIDNYYGTIHEDNSDEWLLDNIHVNAACNEHMAEHFVSVVYRGEY